MKVYGIDFTSAPSTRKPITCADCTMENGSLHLNNFFDLTTFQQFDDFLSIGKDWIAGFDFPFGQPKKLIENLRWPLSWCGYIGIIDKMEKKEFVDTLNQYRKHRPKGDKQHLRVTDIKADSRSPMMLYGVPVGKMFFEGAPRLRKSGVCIIPCHINESGRIVIETYPKLVVKNLISKLQYKNDTKKKQTPLKEDARRQIVKMLNSDRIKYYYGFDVKFDKNSATKIVNDPMGDHLDALLCAVQAGWAYGKRELGYGIPDGYQLEGWIVDPELNSNSKREK